MKKRMLIVFALCLWTGLLFDIMFGVIGISVLRWRLTPRHLCCIVFVFAFVLSLNLLWRLGFAYAMTICVSLCCFYSFFILQLIFCAGNNLHIGCVINFYRCFDTNFWGLKLAYHRYIPIHYVCKYVTTRGDLEMISFYTLWLRWFLSIHFGYVQFTIIESTCFMFNLTLKSWTWLRQDLINGISHVFLKVYTQFLSWLKMIWPHCSTTIISASLRVKKISVNRNKISLWGTYSYSTDFFFVCSILDSDV